MIDTIIQNFESFADIYIRCLVIAYILSMSVVFALWIKPFVHKIQAAYFTAIIYFVFRFIYYLIPVDSDLLQGLSFVVVLISFFVVWISDEKRNPIQKLFLCILFYVMSFLTYEISVEIGLFERDLVSRFDWYRGCQRTTCRSRYDPYVPKRPCGNVSGNYKSGGRKGSRSRDL